MATRKSTGITYEKQIEWFLIGFMFVPYERTITRETAEWVGFKNKTGALAQTPTEDFTRVSVQPDGPVFWKMIEENEDFGEWTVVDGPIEE